MQALSLSLSVSFFLAAALRVRLQDRALLLVKSAEGCVVLSKPVLTLIPKLPKLHRASSAPKAREDACLRIRFTSCQHPDVAGLLKIGSAHLSTESSESSGIYISAHNLSLEEAMNCTSTSSCTFYANATATRSAGFLCPLGTGAVDFQALHDFGCLACQPGDTQVLNVTS
ncbi:unnamed protein product, partial [Symbiodinium necroappetens]